jgi:hypothetical protein
MLLKQNKLKLCSYPFDWIFSNCNNIIHCLEDDFNVFLDKSFDITALRENTEPKLLKY